MTRAQLDSAPPPAPPPWCHVAPTDQLQYTANQVQEKSEVLKSELRQNVDRRDRREERVCCIELIANMRTGWIRSDRGAAGDLSCHPVIRIHDLTCTQQYCPDTAHHGPELSIVCTSGHNANFYNHPLIILHTIYNWVTSPCTLLQPEEARRGQVL